MRQAGQTGQVGQAGRAGQALRLRSGQARRAAVTLALALSVATLGAQRTYPSPQNPANAKSENSKNSANPENPANRENAENLAKLVTAIKSSDHATVSALLAKRVNVNATEVDGTTPLHWAVYNDDLETARLLVRAGAKANIANRYGLLPLTLAAENGNAAMIALLLDAGADVNTVAAKGETALMTAARTGKVDAVDVLIARGASVNAKETWHGQTAIMWAAAEGHAAVVKSLLAHGAERSARSDGGFTPLLFAAREGKIATVVALLDAGVDVNETLRPAVRRPPAASPSNSANPSAPVSRANPSTTASPANSASRANAANAANAADPVNVADPVNDVPPVASEAAGLTAFLLAAGNAHYQLATLLLDRGADPNAAPLGWTVLHQMSWVRKAGIAGSNNPAPEGSGNMTSAEFVRQLVKRGADVNARVTKKPPVGVTALNMIGGTPFLLAARTADAELMALLAELGADPLTPSQEGTTPLMVAAGVGTYAPGEDPGTEPEVLEAVKLALRLGADINAVDKNGETAMHGAAAKHVPAVVRFLAAAGADITVWNRPNKEGFTPLGITQGVPRSMSIVRSAPTEAAMREVMARQAR